MDPQSPQGAPPQQSPFPDPQTAALFGQRIGRLKAALAHQKPDRTPVIAQAEQFNAVHVGASLSRFCSDPFYSAEVICESYNRLPTFDAPEMANCVPDFVAAITLSKMLIAGRDLPEGRPYMVDEQERLTVDDYDTIANVGWKAFFPRYCRERLGFDVGEYFPKMIGSAAHGARLNLAQGRPVFTLPLTPGPPIEPLAGGRSMAKFMRDLFKVPDRVEAAMEGMMPDFLDEIRTVLRSLPVKPLTAFIGCGRGSSEFLSPRFWERFSWRYFKQLCDAIIAEGVVVNMHLEGNWERDLSYFNDFEKGTVLYASEHSTDIYKIKEVCGDRVAIKGDVPSPMLAFGTPDEVYAYSRKLIEDMGDGFILAPACTAPSNSRVENIEAMLAAVNG